MAELEMTSIDNGLDSLESLGADLFGEDNTALDEMVAEIEEEANLSQDLEGFAKGFPDWDLHPPKK